MLAPALKYLADALALSWRKRLTSVAHQRYLTGSTFYGASHLAGMQVRPGDRLPRTLPGAFRELQGHSSRACIVKLLCTMLCVPATSSCCWPRDWHCNAACWLLIGAPVDVSNQPPAKPSINGLINLSTEQSVNRLLELPGWQDVDQRVTRDVERLAHDVAELVPTVVKPLIDLAWFSSQLWALTGRRGSASLYLYAALGFSCLR